MTTEDHNKVLVLTCDSLTLIFGDLSDLPYELVNTVANIYLRFYLLTFVSFPLISLEETLRRQGEFEAITKAVYQFRELPSKGADQNLMEYMETFFLNAFKYRIDNVENKTPFRCLTERKFKSTQDIPDLVKSLGLYK